MLRSKSDISHPDVALQGSGVVIAVRHCMGNSIDKDPSLRRLDALIEEAVTLREQIAAAVLAAHRPFFPERRQANQPHTHERRQSV